MRIGIGHPGIKEMVSPHVLGDFAKADREWLDPLLDAIADNAELLAKRDDNSFMNRLEPRRAGRRQARAGGQESRAEPSTGDRPPPRARAISGRRGRKRRW